MRSFFRSIRQFLSELRRRNVYQVAVTYVVVGFFVIEAADLTLTRLGLPGWTVTFVVVLVGIGFPIALVLAWALEVTPEGVRVEETVAEVTESSEGVPAPASATRDLWVGASVLVLLLLGAWWVFGGLSGENASSTVAGEALDSTRVAVFPFTVGGGKELAYLGEGMVELLGRSIDGAGPLRVADPKVVLARTVKKSTGGLSPDSARRIAARFGAGRFVLGSLLKLGETIRLSGTWYSADGSEIGSAETTGEGETEIQSMVDELARQAIADLTEGGAERRRRLAAQTTSSAEALKAYLKGQQALRAFDFPAAIKAFSEAVEEDSTFALAHYRLTLALGWSARDTPLRRRTIERAVELSDGLPERDRRLLRAYRDYTFGNAERAERLYRTLLQRYPDDAEAHYLLGETLFHFNTARGRPVAEARRHFRRAMQLDPTFRVAFPHRVHIALLERDTSRLDSLTRGREEPRYRAVRAYMLSEDPGPELEKRLREGVPFAYMLAMLMVEGKLKAAREVLGPLTAPERPDEMRANAFVLQAEAFAAHGQLQAARQKIAAVAPLDSATYWTARARHAGFPFMPEKEEQARERREVLEGLADWNAEEVPERHLSFLYLSPRGLYPAARLYALGLLRAIDSNKEGALEAAGRLDSMQPPELAPSAPADFARSIRAEVDRHDGRPQRAIAHLESIENRAGPVLVRLNLLSGARERFVRAELLAEEERFEEALRWYRTLNGPARGKLPYLAPAHFGRAEVLEKLGRPEEAAEAYRGFLNLWKNADPVLQPKVKEARRRLSGLAEETAISSSSASQTSQ